MKTKAKSECAQPEQVFEIISELSFLLKDWEKGDQCFLSLNEIELLFKFGKIPNDRSLADELNLSPGELRKRIQYTVLKLEFNHKQFKQWLAGQILFIIPYPPFTVFDQFLTAPLSRHNLSTRLYNMLVTMECKTINDVLRYSASELLSHRTVGGKSLAELKRLLAENDCCHLLRGDKQYYYKAL